MDSDSLVELGGMVEAVLTSACRIAAKRHADSVGTDDVLRGLFEYNGLLERAIDMPLQIASPHRVGPTNGEAPPALSRQSVRGVHWVLREVHWRVFGVRSASASADDEVPPWTDEVIEAVGRAVALAGEQARPWAGMDHLLRALVVDEGNRATAYLRSRGTTPDVLLVAARRTWSAGDTHGPLVALVRDLYQAGVLSAPAGTRTPRRARLLARAASVGTGMDYALSRLEMESTAEAVRLGHQRVTPVHHILSVLLLEEQMDRTGLRARSADAACDFILRDFGLRHRAALDIAEHADLRGDAAPTLKRRAWRFDPKNPPWTAAASRSAERAVELAAATPLRGGGAHLLHGVLEDSDDAGRLVLRELGGDPDIIRARTKRILGL